MNSTSTLPFVGLTPGVEDFKLLLRLRSLYETYLPYSNPFADKACDRQGVVTLMETPVARDFVRLNWLDYSAMFSKHHVQNIAVSRSLTEQERLALFQAVCDDVMPF